MAMRDAIAIRYRPMVYAVSRVRPGRVRRNRRNGVVALDCAHSRRRCRCWSPRARWPAPARWFNWRARWYRQSACRGRH